MIGCEKISRPPQRRRDTEQVIPFQTLCLSPGRLSVVRETGAGTNPECALESTDSLLTSRSRIGGPRRQTRRRKRRARSTCRVGYTLGFRSAIRRRVRLPGQPAVRGAGRCGRDPDKSPRFAAQAARDCEGRAARAPRGVAGPRGSRYVASQTTHRHASARGGAAGKNGPAKPECLSGSATSILGSPPAIPKTGTWSVVSCPWFVGQRLRGRAAGGNGLEGNKPKLVNALVFSLMRENWRKQTQRGYPPYYQLITAILASF